MNDTNISIQDILYDKSYECPVCDNHFTSKSIKLRKNQVLSIDIDLYAHYSMINPLLYDCILCPKCGYSALSQNFDKLLPTQKQWIKEQVCQKYKAQIFNEYATLVQAITKHKLALLTCMVKKGKIGEQAYISLHIAWLYRDLRDEPNEKIFLSRAVVGFKKAFESERFPIFNLDEITTAYIVSAASYLLKDYQTCKQYLAQVISSPMASSSKLKDRALDLKQMVSTLPNTN